MQEPQPEAIRERVRQLQDFRLRSEAMRELVDIGRPAVEPLVEGLESRNEALRWAAAECLSQIGESSSAVPALIKLLERDGNRTGAVQALQRLTEKPFGADAARWADWWRRRHATISQEDPEARRAEFSELLLQALSDYDAVWRRKGNGYSIHLRPDEDEAREVRVLTDRSDRDGASIIIIYSVCGPAGTEMTEWALRENLARGYASLALRDVEGVCRFVAYHTLLLEGLSRTELRKALVAVSRKATEVDRRIGPGRSGG